LSIPAAASVKRLPRAVRERQMLDAAVKIFALRGFHAASMDEIAELAGVSKPMVYAYLGTKDELFLACLRREATLLLEAVASGVEPSAQPDQQLWNGLRAFFGFVGGRRDGCRASWSLDSRGCRSRSTSRSSVSTRSPRNCRSDAAGSSPSSRSTSTAATVGGDSG